MEKITLDQLQKVTAKNSPNTNNYSNGSKISKEQFIAACSIINKNRIAKGWNILPAEEADVVARVWIELLDTARIPWQAYEELFRRAVGTRAAKMTQGQNPPDLGPELLISLWQGENGFAREFQARNTPKQLTENAESVCPHCFGTSWRVIESGDGYRGVTPCNHR